MSSLNNSRCQIVYYRWIIVAVGFITLGVTFSFWYSFSVFFMAIIDDFGWDHATVSSIFSIFILFQALVGIIAGYLIDRVGPRVVIPLGAVVLSLSLALASQAHSLWHFYASYGVLVGGSVGLLGFPAHSAFIPKWFEKKRGLAAGIMTSGIGVGTILLIPLIEKSITVWGWRTTYLYLAGIFILLIAPLNLIFARNPPKNINLRSDGGNTNEKYRKSNGTMTIKVIDTEWTRQRWTLSKAIKTKRYWFLFMVFLLGSWTFQGVLLHAVSAMSETGLSRAEAAYYFGILGFAGSGGKLLFGYLLDRYGREQANSLACLLACLGTLILISYILPGNYSVLLFVLMFGLGYGVIGPIFASITADIFMGDSFGLIFTTIYIGSGIGGALGPYIFGLLRDISGTYFISFLLSMVSLSLYCLFVWLASPGKIRKLVKREPQ